MICVNRSIRTPEEGAAFVALCDQNFEYRLGKLVRETVHRENLESITLSGPTCSGKTTAARKLIEEINASGKVAKVFSIDDFYKNRADMPVVDGRVDLDSIASIDVDYLRYCVDRMLRELPATLPRYSFHTGTRVGTYEYTCTPNDILVFEGIQAIYPEVTALFDGHVHDSIYIAVMDDITVNGVFFSANEVRLARRIVRDFRFRSAAPDLTLELWQGVRDNEDKNIFPHVGSCRHVINSLQPYELFMLAQFAVPLLQRVPESSPYAADAAALCEKLSQLSGNDIDPACLPVNSIYHEFLG